MQTTNQVHHVHIVGFVGEELTKRTTEGKDENSPTILKNVIHQPLKNILCLFLQDFQNGM